MPLSCNFVKLVDVEEMNYFASNGEGEVGLRKYSKVGGGERVAVNQLNT